VAAPRRRAELALILAALAACTSAPPEPERGERTTTKTAAPATSTKEAPIDAGPSDAGSADAAIPDAGETEDPMLGHFDRLEDLLKLIDVKDTARFRRKVGAPDAFLARTIGLSSPARVNQGNKAIAHHAVARSRCLEGLKDVVLQTDEQRRQCGGAANMVPIYKKGRREAAKTCIDVFEFPNHACELPVVWTAPIQASLLCQVEGKRLCTQEEWTLACRGDPDGDKDRVYAYGEELDLDVCNTNKAQASFKDTTCDADSAGTAWKTCGTNTEPAGAFPRCRSRFGVFDQHGNVAEIMTRLDPDGTVYSQLKGSAFFYVDVARGPKEVPPKDRETYPDTCSYDPRWHVEPMDEAWHVNYHLGFRCCKSIP
jgi:sulfatase modifying factor 1